MSEKTPGQLIFEACKPFPHETWNSVSQSYRDHLEAAASDILKPYLDRIGQLEDAILRTLTQDAQEMGLYDLPAPSP